MQWRTLGPPFEAGFKVRTVDYKGAQWVIAMDLARHFGFAHNATGMARIKRLVGPENIDKISCVRSADDKKQRGFIKTAVVSPNGLSVVRAVVLQEGLKPRRGGLTPEQARRAPAEPLGALKCLAATEGDVVAKLREENDSLRRRLAEIESLSKDERA